MAGASTPTAVDAFRRRSRPAELSVRLPTVVPAFDRNTIRGEPVGNVTSRIRMVRNVSAVAGNDSCRYPLVFANRADAVPWIGVALSSVTTPVAESTPVVGSSRPPSNVIWRTVVPPPGGGVGVGVGVGVAVGAGVGVAVGAGVGGAVPVGVGVCLAGGGGGAG